MANPPVTEPLVVGQSNDLDRLIGLCDEISALVRAGMPLEESLLVMGRARRGKLGRKLRELAETLGTGKPLAEAVGNDPSFPPVFAAVVESGIESGNLSGALDSISQSVRTLRDTRLFLLRSLLYPLILFTSLWLIFSFVVLVLAPRFIDFFDSYQQQFFLFDWIRFLLADKVRSIMFVFSAPVLLWLVYFIWFYLSSRNHLIQSSGFSLLLRGIPWVGSACIELQKASFARILSMLLHSSLPLDRSLMLAAQACSDRYWSRESLESLQNRIVQGQRDRRSIPSYPKSVLSPLIEWSLGISNRQMLLEGIDHYARIARTRAELLLAKCEMFFPAILTLILAALIGLCYFMTILWPYIHILHFLSGPIPTI